MEEKLQKAIKVVLGGALGVFIGRSLWLRQDVRARPELYQANSAPWYTPLLWEGAILLGLFLLGGLAWWLLDRRRKK